MDMRDKGWPKCCGLVLELVPGVKANGVESAGEGLCLDGFGLVAPPAVLEFD
jgi:hypothetical protein